MCCIIFSIWQDIADFHFQRGQKFSFLPQKKKSLFMRIKWFFLMVVVNIFHFWPSWKWKSAISCQNEKTMRQIFYMLQNTWKCIRKSLKSCENVEGKISHFCLGPKTWLGYYDPCFDLSSKVSVVGSWFW